jgi:3-hydroxymyristoyl/3-hydroxydecanoyl-(acyl carrier protein) dehydratase
MIKSSLPRVLSSQEGENLMRWQLFVAAAEPCFDGHFPGQPVLPGVTQLDWAIRLGCGHFGYPLEVATLEVLKFQQLLLPNSRVTLEISHDAAKAKLSFAYVNGDSRYASGRIAMRRTETA